MRNRLSELGLALAAAACSSGSLPARPQLVVVIDTDLPVPPDPNAPPPAQALPALVDTARVEVVKRGTTTLACDAPSACSRDFALDQEQLGQHLASFGLVSIASDAELRIRLFRHDAIDAYGQPVPGATDEVRARPVLPSDGVVSETFVVPGDAWGQPETSAPVVEGVPGTPPTVAGQWKSAQPTPCAIAPRTDSGDFDGEECIPGGAFLRDAQTGALSSFNFGVFQDARVVILSPFLMDTYELTVARFANVALPPGVDPPVTYAASDAQNPWRAYCTLGSPFPDADALPLNCVSAATADAICAALGERLPTETEFAYASSGRDTHLFPWGTSFPEYPSTSDPNDILQCCDGVVFERYPPGPAITAVVYDDCSSAGPSVPNGPYPARPEPVNATSERTLTGACASIRDLSRDGVSGLGGNLEEWTADYFEDEGCWPDPTPQRDPSCPPPTPTAASATAYRAIAGSSWLDAPLTQAAGLRLSESTLDTLHDHPGTGFRCDADGGGAAMIRSLRVKLALAGVVVAAATANGCSTAAPDRDEVVVVIDTDAPVPSWVDRLHVEVFDAKGTTPLDSHDYTLPGPANWPLSFGIHPAAARAPLSVRLRLRAYNSSRPASIWSMTISGKTYAPGDPDGYDPTWTIDRVAPITASAGVGLVEARLVLRADCFGAPADVVAGTTCVDAPGQSVSAPAPSLTTFSTSQGASIAGSWLAAQPVGCTATPRAESGLFDEEVCVPGGAYVMGNASEDNAIPAAGDLIEYPEKVVQVSPFLMDRYEVSAGRLRAAMNDPVNPFVPPTEPTMPDAPIDCGTAVNYRFCTWHGAQAARTRPPTRCR